MLYAATAFGRSSTLCALQKNADCRRFVANYFGPDWSIKFYWKTQPALICAKSVKVMVGFWDIYFRWFSAPQNRKAAHVVIYNFIKLCAPKACAREALLRFPPAYSMAERLLDAPVLRARYEIIRIVGDSSPFFLPQVIDWVWLEAPIEITRAAINNWLSLSKGPNLRLFGRSVWECWLVFDHAFMICNATVPNMDRFDEIHMYSFPPFNIRPIALGLYIEKYRRWYRKIGIERVTCSFPQRFV